MKLTGAAALAVCLSAAAVQAAGRVAEEPQDLPTMPLDLPGDELPELPLWEWGMTANVQIDGLANSELPAAREKGVELRRARISGLIQWKFDWLVKAGLDLADGPRLGELALEYRGRPVYFEIGRIVEPFGVLQGGSRAAALMERPQATGLAPGYGIGIAANARGASWGLSGGVFRATRNDEFDEGGREENAITVRATWTPLRGEDHLVHLGAAGSNRESDEGFLQFTAIPETVLLLGLNSSSQLLIADGGSGNGYRLFGAEVATLLGPVLVQAELMQANLDDVFVFDDTNFTVATARPRYGSYYAEAAWAITGERRDYSTRRGTIGGIHPERPLLHGGWGAIELAARTSRIDLDDDIIGGERGRVHSAGINWFPDERLKLMLTALQIEEIRESGTEKVRAVQARIQGYFTAP